MSAVACAFAAAAGQSPAPRSRYVNVVVAFFFGDPLGVFAPAVFVLGRVTETGGFTAGLNPHDIARLRTSPEVRTVVPLADDRDATLAIRSIGCPGRPTSGARRIRPFGEP